MIDRIGVEGTGSLGRPVVTTLNAAGYDVREVQANRTAERRRRRRRAKTDLEDAEAVARETLAHSDLPPAGKSRTPDPARAQLAAVRDWRSSLVLQRVRLLTEAEAVLVSLPLQVRHALATTSRVLPQLQALAAMTDLREQLGGVDQIKLDRLTASLTDITTLTAGIKHLDRQLPDLLDALGCTLTELCGIGDVTAMELHVEIGDPMRFRTQAEFARWCGAAPVALSSGEGGGPVHRHRLDLGGNRDVNSLHHIVHVTQARCSPTTQNYLDKKITRERKTYRDARRAHKRQLANIIIRHMWNDARHPDGAPCAA